MSALEIISQAESISDIRRFLSSLPDASRTIERIDQISAANDDIAFGLVQARIEAASALFGFSPVRSYERARELNQLLNYLSSLRYRVRDIDGSFVLCQSISALSERITKRLDGFFKRQQTKDKLLHTLQRYAVASHYFESVDHAALYRHLNNAGLLGQFQKHNGEAAVCVLGLTTKVKSGTLATNSGREVPGYTHVMLPQAIETHFPVGLSEGQRKALLIEIPNLSETEHYFTRFGSRDGQARYLPWKPVAFREALRKIGSLS
jgi:hypothetical protein